MRRPTWERTWLEVAQVVARRGTCPRLQVGAVIVTPDNQVAAVGYNGAPRGMPHCDEAGCMLLQDGSCVRGVHAEQNALLRAGRIEGGAMYLTHSPCWRCAVLIAQSGLALVTFLEAYRRVEGYEDPLEVLVAGGVLVSHAGEKWLLT